MKLYITLQQWNGVSLEDRKNLKIIYPISIGDMIEFLREGLSIDNDRYGIIWYKNEEVCDILWTKCKYKLKNLIK